MNAITGEQLVVAFFASSDNLIMQINFCCGASINFDWEQRKLEKISQRVKGNDGRMDLPILTISAKQGWLTQKKRFSANIAGKELKNYTLLKKGQLSYNHGNSKAAMYGTVYGLQSYPEALVPKVYHSFKLSKGISDIFVQSYFHAKKLDRQLRRLISSTARMDGLLNISFQDFMQIQLAIPNIKEQQKISKLIIIIEKLIDLQQRKLAQLKLLKKAMLQQLFASQNQVFPITRFKNFDGDWEQRKFEQFIEVEKKKNKSGFSYDPYSISNVDGFVPQNEQFGEGNTYSKTDKKSNYIVEPHSFAYNPARINVGSIGYQHFEKSVLVSSLYEIFKTKNDINDYFLWYWFHTRSFTDQVMKYQEGGVRQYYFIDKLKISKIKIPTFREQKLIAEFLRLLEINITLQQNKLTHLNKLKKFLLQKMFM